MKFIRSFALLSLFVFLTACGSGTMQASSALTKGNIKLSNYQYVVIKKNNSALFMELELEALLEEQNLKVIGKNAAKQKIKNRRNKILHVRYKETEKRGGYGNVIGTSLTILLEDFATSKTLLSVNGNQLYGSRSLAWQEVAKKLRSAFSGVFS